jgi:DUF971 family protein
VLGGFDFLNSFIPSASNGHPNQGQMELSFQKSKGKITKLKNRGKITIRFLDKGKNTIFPYFYYLKNEIY